MSRPWVKLSAGIYRHPELGLLSDRAWRRFVECIALAGDTEGTGRLGTWKAVARLLYVSESQLRSDVATMDGRVFADDDGVLWVRDWDQHQPAERKPEPAAQVTERSRRLREQRRGNADATQPLQDEQRSGNDALELEVELDVEEEQRTETTEGTASAVAAPATAPEPEEPAPPKREPLGPGAKLFKVLTHASPNVEQRTLLDAAYGRHGPEKFESVIREWLRLGYRKQNADGMVNVMERGWTKRQPANGRGVLANGHSASPDEAAAIDQVIAEGMADVAARLEAPALAPADADRIWRDVHAGLALRMPAATLKAWVDPVQVVGFDGETLTLLAPTAAVHSWLTQRLARELDEALADVAPGVDWVVLAPGVAVVEAAA